MGKLANSGKFKRAAIIGENNAGNYHDGYQKGCVTAAITEKMVKGECVAKLLLRCLTIESSLF